MQEARTVTLTTGRSQTNLEVDAIHYILMKRNYAEIHADWGEVIRARATMAELEAALGSGFIKVHRSCLVSAAQIHHIGDAVVLRSGEKLTYAKRQKEEIVSRLCALRDCTPAGVLLKNPRSVGRKTRPAKTAPVPEQKPVAQQEEPEVELLPEERCLPVTVNRKTRLVPINTILYIRADKGVAAIHMLDGNTCETRTPLHLLEEALGDGFLRVGRGYLVSVMAIHGVTDAVHLSNGETIPYPHNRKAELCRLLSSRQKLFIDCLTDDATPTTEEAYREYYRSFDNLPFAFTDIEMVFNEERHAVDWIFRYGNPALARLEKMPLKKLIGRSFGSMFTNMDSKWLRSYEQAVLYGKTLEIIDYSPEIDTNLKIICFPTFKGHCGCILFDIDHIRLSENSGFQQVLKYYQGKLPE